MVFFNYATMQMAAKIVYYGPGLCGKTTNLHHIYAKTSPQSRGEMVSLETETDRTLFFDLLPIDVGVIGGFKTRLQLYTIPGQVFYNTTRKLVLKGVDGIVFVADSQAAMQDANADSFKNLRDNLAEIGLNLDDIPLVLQLNKRDLPNLATIDAMLDLLDPDRKYEHIESVAATGVGVFETLKLISKLTLRTLRRRMTGDEPSRSAAPSGRMGSLRVKDPSESHGTMSGNVPLPPPGTPPPSTPAFATPVPSAANRAAPAVGAADEDVEEIEASQEVVDEDAFAQSTLAKTAEVGASVISDAPVANPVSPPAQPAEPDVRFSETKAAAAAPEVKHVKVRSSVDVMAELEALRKRATAGTSTRPKKEPSPLDGLLGKKPRREIHKSVDMKVPSEVLPKSKSLRVTVSFENSDGVLQTQEQSIDVSDASDAQSLSVNLRIDS